jgi:hypothetical protein
MVLVAWLQDRPALEIAVSELSDLYDAIVISDFQCQHQNLSQDFGTEGERLTSQQADLELEIRIPRLQNVD